VGRLSCQVKPLQEATSPRIIPDVIHVSSKNAREQKKTPKRQEENSGTDENTMEAPIDLYEPTISSLGPTGHVNLLLDVKVISS
jgi:hypothetical protein